MIYSKTKKKTLNSASQNSLGQRPNFYVDAQQKFFPGVKHINMIDFNRDI